MGKDMQRALLWAILFTSCFLLWDNYQVYKGEKSFFHTEAVEQQAAADAASSVPTGKDIDATVPSAVAVKDPVVVETDRMKVTFDREGGFSASLGEQKLEGKYTYDAETHVVSLSSDHEKLKQYGAVAGRAYIDGSALQLLIPATKLLEIVQSVSAQSESLAGVSTLLANYQNLYIGFSFTRKE